MIVSMAFMKLHREVRSGTMSLSNKLYHTENAEVHGNHSQRIFMWWPQVESPQTDAKPASELAALMPSPSRASKTRKGGLRFTDKDEHMYFWFPLLAGLSELTFDPRPDVRYLNTPDHPIYNCQRFHVFFWLYEVFICF